MKIVIIHGQNHIGSTCTIARELAGKVGGDIRE
ncbi:MAG: flavin reductase, partial [Lachnospiraceae bacterium]|nr:flavin reductase [Lachnospiraceae bacterium]